MYCPSCGIPVEVKTEVCTECGYFINEKLFEFEPEKTRKDLEKFDIKNNKIFGIISYLGPLLLLSLFKAKDSNFAKFHANQGIISALLFLISGLSFLIKNIGNALGIILIFFSLSITMIGIYNASKGLKKELPIVGKIQILK